MEDQEMYLLSKYKFIRLSNQFAEKAVQKIVNAGNVAEFTTKEVNVSDKQAEIDLKEKLKAEKLAKKEKMKAMCQPGEKKDKKTKFVEKEKFVNKVPKGEKKGNIYIIIN